MTNNGLADEPTASGGCGCNKVSYEILGAPLFRAYCHCRTCQAYNDAERADIVVMRSVDLKLNGEEQVSFSYHQYPPIINRGRCASCDGVAVEKMRLPLLPGITIIPAQTLREQRNMLAPEFHMFYHRRVAEVDDDLPKYSGYIASQLAFSRLLLKRLRVGRAEV